MPLLYAPIEKDLRITNLLMNSNVKKHLLNLGFYNSAKIKVCSICNSNVIVFVNNSRIGISKDVASQIMVALS